MAFLTARYYSKYVNINCRLQLMRGILLVNWQTPSISSFEKYSSQKTCCIHPLKRRRGGTRRSVLFRVPTRTSWMWSVQVQFSWLFSIAIGCSWHLSTTDWEGRVLMPIMKLILFFSGCYKITTVFSHAQTVVLCVGCSTVLCQPTGGKARLTEGQY